MTTNRARSRAAPSRERARLRGALRASERAGARAALTVLRRELGLLATAQVAVSLAAARLRGEPFALLGPPADHRELWSRRQARDLILLHRAITAHRDADTALGLCREVARRGGVVFLQRLIPGPPATAEQAREIARRFFNAEGDIEVRNEHTLAFTVRRCRFVELCRVAGVPELTPVFCDVDNAFFADSRDIDLSRHQTLATGGRCCDFVFTRRGPSDAAISLQ